MSAFVPHTTTLGKLIKAGIKWIGKDSVNGRKDIAKKLDMLANDGWEIKSKETTQQGLARRHNVLSRRGMFTFCFAGQATQYHYRDS